MSSIVKNPWEMGEEYDRVLIPDFTLAKYMVVKLNPPKRTGSVRDGLVATLAMLSYHDADDKEIKMIEVSTAPNGYSVEFPNGKRGILATKYRGPKFPSVYKFVNSITGKWYTLPKEVFTEEYAENYLSEKLKGWSDFSEADKADQIDQYFEDMFMFGLAKDFNLSVEEDPTLQPHIGLVTDFYRRYSPPKGDERYGNIIATKFAPREGKETLSGEFKTVDDGIAETIYDAIVSKDENTSFDPTSFEESNDKEEAII